MVEETGVPGENHWQTLSHNTSYNMQLVVSIYFSFESSCFNSIQQWWEKISQTYSLTFPVYEAREDVDILVKFYIRSRGHIVFIYHNASIVKKIKFLRYSTVDNR